MGVVHLARRGDAASGSRSRCCGPHIVGDDEARARLAREVSSLSRIRSRWVAEIVDADPWATGPLRRDPLRPRSLAARPRPRGGPDRGRRPLLVRGLPGRGARVGARGRGAAPRHQAVQRADGGPHPDPHRLRTGPGRRRPQAHPHRLAARHARLPRARDPATATTRPPPRTCTPGPPPSRSPAPAGRPFGRGPSMAIMDRVRRGEHDLSGLARAAARLLAEALDPEPRNRPSLAELRDWLAPLAGLDAAAGRSQAEPEPG